MTMTRKLTEYAQKTHGPFIFGGHWTFRPACPSRTIFRDTESSLTSLVFPEKAELYFLGIML